MDKNKLIRQLDDMVINSKPWSFWEDTTIQDLELNDFWGFWAWKVLITKWWETMSPFNVDIIYDENWKISCLKSEKELNKAFKKKYSE